MCVCVCGGKGLTEVNLNCLQTHAHTQNKVRESRHTVKREPEVNEDVEEGGRGGESAVQGETEGDSVRGRAD